MKILLYILALVLLTSWAIGIFLLDVGKAIHLLPLIAITLGIRSSVKQKEPVYIDKHQTWKVRD